MKQSTNCSIGKGSFERKHSIFLSKGNIDSLMCIIMIAILHIMPLQNKYCCASYGRFFIICTFRGFIGIIKLFWYICTYQAIISKRQISEKLRCCKSLVFLDNLMILLFFHFYILWYAYFLQSYMINKVFILSFHNDFHFLCVALYI